MYQPNVDTLAARKRVRKKAVLPSIEDYREPVDAFATDSESEHPESTSDALNQLANLEIVGQSDEPGHLNLAFSLEEADAAVNNEQLASDFPPTNEVNSPVRFATDG